MMVEKCDCCRGFDPLTTVQLETQSAMVISTSSLLWCHECRTWWLVFSLRGASTAAGAGLSDPSRIFRADATASAVVIHPLTGS